MIGYMGIIVALAVLIIGTFRKIGILPMTLVASLIVALTNGLDVWTSFGTYYANGFASSFGSYVLIFCFSCLYSKLMELSGSASAIAYKIISLVGAKNVMTACCIVAAVLVYGGISGFVIAYVLIPIMFTLFDQADIPRHLCMGPIMFGCGTFVMGPLPGTTQLTNVILAEAFNTSLTAAPIMGLLSSLFCALFALAYLNWAVKKARKRGEHFTFPEGTNVNHYRAADPSALPATWKSFAPVVVMILLIIIGSQYASDTTELTVGAIILACIICALLNWGKLKDQNPKVFVTEGLSNGITAISGLAAVTGMGQVVLNTVSYTNLIDIVVGINANPYIKGAVAAAAMSAITGSSAAGTRVAVDSLSSYLISSGCNLGQLQRIMSLASLSLTSLPNCAGHYIHLNLLKQTQGDCYRHTFMVNTVPCGIAAILCLIYVAIAG